MLSFFRNSSDEEKNWQAWTVASSSPTECGNPRNTSHHSPYHSMHRQTGMSSFCFTSLSIFWSHMDFKKWLSDFIWQTALYNMRSLSVVFTLGTSNFKVTQHHPHPCENAKWQWQFPQCIAWPCECLDQVHPVCDKIHPRCHLWDCLAGNQLLAESGEGIGEDWGTVKEWQGEHGHGLLAKCEAFLVIESLVQSWFLGSRA